MYYILKNCFFTADIQAEASSIYFKGDSNPNDNLKYVWSERALWTMNFEASIIKIGWKNGEVMGI